MILQIMEKNKLRKKKATKKEIEKLREAFIKIWRDPVAMQQAKEIAHTA